MRIDNNDHTKQYRRIDGHLVCISFSDEPNPELFSRIRDILLTCSDTRHICREDAPDATIPSSAKEAS